MSTIDCLFEPIELGDISLKNRIIMAPMTRSRADNQDTPTALMAEYYEQRASAGLIITEGAHPSIHGKGYCRTPGMYNQDHVNAWKNVVDRVHAKGGTIVLQVMHCGRVGHPENKLPEAINFAPSAIEVNAEVFTEQGMKTVPMPQAMTLNDIETTIQEYVTATILAFEAGFDGVELHCTSGYLPAQFLSTGSNKRDDEYGGTLNNRLRFVLEVLSAMSEVKGAGRIGMRICPGNPFNDLHDDSPLETYKALLQAVNPLGLAYVHAIHSPDPSLDVLAMLAQNFKGSVIINENYNVDTAAHVISKKGAQAVSFGKPYIANPDLVERFKGSSDIAHFDPEKLYTSGAEGYTNYPVVND